MTQKLSFALSFFVALVVTLLTFSAKAQSNRDADMRILESGDSGYDAYVSYLAEIREDADAVRCVYHQCQRLRNFAPRTWRHGRYYEQCYQNHLQRKKRADYKPLENPPSVNALLCSVALETELPGYNKEVSERVFSHFDKPAPKRAKSVPQPIASGVELNLAMVELDANEVATNEVLSASPPPPAIAPVPPKSYDFQVERYNQWRTAHPEAAAKANRTAQQATKPPGYARVKINCIPEHVSVVKIAENGDLTLFIHAGADITRLAQCLPNHDFDPIKVVSSNIAAATIPYHLDHLEYADRPIRNNKLNFHQGRWHLKRSEWNTGGKEFFADFFRENKGKQFGFALQGGQRLGLSAKLESSAPTPNAPVTGPNEPAKHGKYKQVQSEEKQLRVASMEFANQTASECEPVVTEISARVATRTEAELSRALSQNRSNYSDAKQSITPAGWANIQAEPRVARVMYIQEKRYRRGDGADLNLQENFVRHQALNRLPYREHYGQFAFG